VTLTGLALTGLAAFLGKDERSSAAGTGGLKDAHAHWFDSAVKDDFAAALADVAV